MHFSYAYYHNAINKTLKSFVRSLPLEIRLKSGYIIKGKKLRSSLMYKVADTLQLLSEEIITPSAVLELIHSTTIIHDDVLDQTYKRRGKKTIHNYYKKRIAVFSANQLFSFALGKFASNANYSLQNYYYRKINDVLAGEIAQDTQNDIDCPLAIEDALDIARKKTGSLFALSFVTPAILNGVDKKVIDGLEKMGDFHGTVYQLLDDYKDVTKDIKMKNSNGKIQFRHWTIANLLWNKIDSQNFRNFVFNNHILPEIIKKKILDELQDLIQNRIFRFKNWLNLQNDKQLNQCYKVLQAEIHRFSPIKLNF